MLPVSYSLLWLEKDLTAILHVLSHPALCNLAHKQSVRTAGAIGSDGHCGGGPRHTLAGLPRRVKPALTNADGPVYSLGDS